MIETTTWKHNFTNYANIEFINNTGKQHLEIFQPLAGNKIRLQLNNLFDENPLNINELNIYLNPNDKKSVTLNGQTSFDIPARLVVWSDWINLEMPDNNFLSIDLISSNPTIHSIGMTISNDLIKTENTAIQESKYFFGISALQVQTNQEYKRIAFFGDSLTNQGNFTAPLSLNLESNFQIMAANYGISGNRILHAGNSVSQWSTSFGEAGFTRFDHMISDFQPNIVVFMEGVNDLLHPGTGTPISELPTPEALIDAVKVLQHKCERHSISFVPMTLTPADGNINGGRPAWTDEKESIRLAVNKEILKLPNAIDLAEFVGQNGQLKPEFDCGDHVHFSANGGKLAAKYIEEQLIRKRLI